MSCYGEGRPKPTVKWHRLVIKYFKLKVPYNESVLFTTMIFTECNIRIFLFQGKKLPDGREEIKGETITFVDVSRHHSGRYECIADNGYGKVSISFILYGDHLLSKFCYHHNQLSHFIYTQAC